jgi:diaminopimelate epimerase
MMRIPFWKMHGAGNDFILIDDRTLTAPCGDTAWINRTCTRRTGIGAEGMLLIQPSQKATFRMRFFNPDGCEVNMCGNAARCVARLACDLEIAPRDMQIESAAGILTARVMDSHVGVTLTPPTDWEHDITLELNGTSTQLDTLNTGVPHAVIILKQVRDVDLRKLGSAIRHHPHFAPAGTNANIASVAAPDTLRLRTYERGVEGETLACGTGIAATALVAARQNLVNSPVQVLTAGGDTLSVTFDRQDDTFSNVRLTGPAEYVCEGILPYTPDADPR